MNATKTNKARLIESGEWQFEETVKDYRAEWPGNMLVERATWGPNTPTMMTVKLQGSEPEVIAAADYIWFRFWLAEDEQIVERYFSPSGEPLGSYLPITMELEKKGQSFQAIGLILGLWIAKDGRVTVLNEADFDASVASGDVNPVESERAELRIRAMTSALSQKRFPPALVRNFTISIGQAQGGEAGKIADNFGEQINEQIAKDISSKTATKTSNKEAK